MKYSFMGSDRKGHKKYALHSGIGRVIISFMKMREGRIKIDIGFGLEVVKSVSFNGTELHWCGDIALLDDSLLSDDEVRRICFESGYRPVYQCKTDVTVNGHNILIRNQNKTDRPLINHSTRDKFKRICEEEGITITPLDEMVKVYWQRRFLGVINEDISNLVELSPFRESKEYLKPILTKMFFEGVVPKHGLSADVFLDYDEDEPWNAMKWHPYTRTNYIDHVWEHLRFSFRADRGMPSGYSPDKTEYKEIKPWAYEWKNREGQVVYKGALHIRVVNFDSDNISAPPFVVRNAELIRRTKANRGEIDEIIIKLYLIEARAKKLCLPLGEKQELIRFVGMHHNKTNQLYEFGNLPFLSDWNAMSVEELLAISQYCKIEKAGPSYKADVIVNMKGISLKSERGAAPSIINTTMRSKIKNVMDILHQPMVCIDAMVDNYWKLRLAGKIGEDISNQNPLSPFLSIENEEGKRHLEALLTYFSFDGTGSRISKSPADYILEFKNPLNVDTWVYYSRDQYIGAVFRRLIFSVRNHNMPKPVQEDISWVREIEGKQKGQLNVRIGKR